MNNTLLHKINQRKQENALRKLSLSENKIDFYSNDYLGFSNSKEIKNNSQTILEKYGYKNGSTGSRLISGNYPLIDFTENYIAKYHNSQSALLFNSGYDANLGLLSSVPQRNDIVFFDENVHASIRDGIRLSYAKSFKFKHNEINYLEKELEKARKTKNINEVYIVTESVFSMDGDSVALEKLVEISEKYNAHIILDEAHAIGVLGNNGGGLAEEKNLENKIFARIVTYGKAMGCHGATVLGSSLLKQYLINFARSFIYTTAPSPHQTATILAAYYYLENAYLLREKLSENINHYKDAVGLYNLKTITNSSAIRTIIIPTNNKAKELAEKLQKNNFNIKAILSPTVAKGTERLRICLHSYNTKEEIYALIKMISKFV